MNVKELKDILSKYDENLKVISTGIDNSGYSHHDGPPNAIFVVKNKLYLTHIEEPGYNDCFTKSKYRKDLESQSGDTEE